MTQKQSEGFQRAMMAAGMLIGVLMGWQTAGYSLLQQAALATGVVLIFGWHMWRAVSAEKQG